ncbi:MAG: class I SAM-dependent methyltransferase [Acidobacteria bacterium]|nr:class I SAM-dependent methyltransferase [Acidobacteriota bacterium]
MSSEPPHDRPGPAAGRRSDWYKLRGVRRLLGKALFAIDPVEVKARLGNLEERVESEARFARALQRAVELVRDERVPAVEARLDAAETVLRDLQGILETMRDQRMPGFEVRLDMAEGAASQAASAVAAIRDERLPALTERADVLVERLAEELEEVASLTERILRREPLPVPEPGPPESELARELAEVQPRLVEAFRGTEEEIRHRMEAYLPLLEGHAPVLDLGCGRGELLLLLGEAGLSATGVEGDPALAQAARRRGLQIVEGDVLAVLRQQDDAVWGAVTASHLFEHLPARLLLNVLHEVHRVLRPGGVLVAECPNPHSLRVGASLFWLDPTHWRPLPPETLSTLLKASGFAVEGCEFIHPFPGEQRLHRPAGEDGGDVGRRLDELESRLDEVINGARDFRLRATKPAPNDG